MWIVRPILDRYWSLAAAISLPVVEFFTEGFTFHFVDYEILRAILSVVCILLLGHSWFKQLKYSRGKRRLAFFTIFLSLVALGPVWVGLNVIRFYAYPEHCECSFPIFNAERVYSVVSILMDAVELFAKVICVVVALWAVVDIARWMGSASSSRDKGVRRNS